MYYSNYLLEKITPIAIVNWAPETYKSKLENSFYQKLIFTTGNIIEGQLYQICIRQEVGTCSIAYSVKQG